MSPFSEWARSQEIPAHEKVMANDTIGQTVGVSDLQDGDNVLVRVNSRAENHLETRTFRATVERVMFEDVTFSPIDKLPEENTTLTWYSDIGYIHGFHTGLGRYSDIGKVLEVRKVD